MLGNIFLLGLWICLKKPQDSHFFQSTIQSVILRLWGDTLNVWYVHLAVTELIVFSKKQILKESVVALINATIISMLVYIYNFVRFGPTATVSYSVSLSLFAVVMFASIFGTLVPMTLEKLKIDPAIATGPFISITNDIIGMMLYMGITVLLS